MYSFKSHISFTEDLENHRKSLSRAIKNSSILVIGGAGTIGSNYTKLLLQYSPQKIVVVDFNENGLTELTRDLRSSNLLDNGCNLITYPINLLDSTFIKIFKKNKFDVIANFAAHKHVRSEKDEISIEALLKNNVYGAIKLLNICDNAKPNFFFSVSTDKAANPVNIMGASKSLMEKLIISKKYEINVRTARFANVAFSNGSLLDGFDNRLKKLQPLSCPNNIKRFFVTPEQSGQICVLATFLGESGDIFFPKLNFETDQIYFKDIALEFLKNHGFRPVICDSEIDAKNFSIHKNSDEYPVYFFESDTSGEKTYEEFYTNDENYFLENYDSLGFIKPCDVKISFDQLIADFDRIFDSPSSKSDLINVVKKYVPNFDHLETGKNLDQKM